MIRSPLHLQADSRSQSKFSWFHFQTLSTFTIPSQEVTPWRSLPQLKITSTVTGMFHWLLWGTPICLQGISKRQSTDKRSFMKVSELQKAAMQSCWLWLRDAGVTSAKCCSTKRAQCSTLCKTFKNSPLRAEKQPPQVKMLKHAKVHYF